MSKIIQIEILSEGVFEFSVPPEISVSTVLTALDWAAKQINGKAAIHLKGKKIKTERELRRVLERLPIKKINS